MTESIHKRIGQILQSANRTLILAHVRPDGDAIGAMLGLGLSMAATGKQVVMASSDGIAAGFKQLKGSENIIRKYSGDFDLVVTLDCADIQRVSGLTENQRPDLNIDHHITNQYFGKENYIEPDSAATSAILAKHLPGWGFQIPSEAAQALLYGVVSDTLGFRTTNTTPETLRLTAELMEKGADLSDIYIRALMKRPIEAAKYWGAGLSRVQKQERLVWTYLTLSDRAIAEYPGNDDADLNAVLSNIDDCDISLLFVEQPKGKVKISWRSSDGWDVSRLALRFGGGGHPAAAGAEITGKIEEVINIVLPPTMSLLSSIDEFNQPQKSIPGEKPKNGE